MPRHQATPIRRGPDACGRGAGSFRDAGAPLPPAALLVLSSHACRPLALEMPPEVEVELARRVPCSVTYHEITRDRKVER
jgi:uncharacterized spore protein YtfJ